MLHKWISTDSPEYDACLTCGGMWRNTDPGAVVLHFDTMQGADGSPAVPCTGNTSQCHHYAGECPKVDACNIDVDCNCLHCYS